MRYTISVLLTLSISYLGAQSTDIPLNAPAYHILDEWDVKAEKSVFTTLKPISRRYFAESIEAGAAGSSRADVWDKAYLERETRAYQDSVEENEKPLFGRFFQYPADVFSVGQEDFDLHVNPVIVLGLGRETDSRFDKPIFENYRGLELRGRVDNKVSFYTLLTENQARYPNYVQQVTDSTLAVPYEGFWKAYNNTGVDFLRAQAYIDFNVSKHISAQFGYGKHFIGDGRRSLILSDVGNNYPYLRINTRVWKVQYTNIFAQLIGETTGGTYGLDGIGSFSKKHLASHHLSINAAPNLTVGLFESVIYGDSSGTLKLDYLNPLIFYRALEQQDGSSDNVLLGLDFKWNLWQCISLYGQLVVDELILGEAFSKSGWWGNKQGFQLGAKYFDVFGIEDLNGQVELNRVRPYVYGHETNFTSYSHYNMALAHPLGANFQEVLFSLNFRPLPKLKVQGDLLTARYGDDQGNLNYGRDVLKTYLPASRPGDYDNQMYQGVDTRLLMGQAKVSYQIYHNMLLDLDLIWRRETSDMDKQETTIVATTFRWNFPSRSYLF
ncbi:hypothetical protein [Marinoscillum sp. 108]|uniref:hypothetical protein n=1 Tax=Marinoscillum sp. 108 TaxID=2653151 RepID=UPI0012F153CD|nr:hypothetical protein [Marinoscillum sp. 108]VXD18605.1 conserved hypothetical protein [Marinoscillum sp. 108]